MAQSKSSSKPIVALSQSFATKTPYREHHSLDKQSLTAVRSGTAVAAHQWCGLDLHWVYSDLLASIHRQTRCMQWAYDVLHDALIRYVLLNKHEDILQPHAYLRRVVGSVLSNHREDAARYRALPEEDGNSQLRHNDSLLAPSAEHVNDLKQRLELVDRILSCLPVRCRQVFWLFRIDGYKQKDIAEQLGISQNMVERHIIRAMVDLRTVRELLEN